MNTTAYRRMHHGLTLIETLVVVAALGLLAGLLLVAVNGARESARRTECANHLRQIGIALASHHAAHSHFPSGAKPDGTTRQGWTFAGPLPFSIHAHLLAVLGEPTVYNAMNIPYSRRYQEAKEDASIWAANATVRTLRLAVFLCPSDASPVLGGNNYRGCVGAKPFMIDGMSLPGGGGAFPALEFTADRDFTDGLSQTIGFSERLRGSGVKAYPSVRRDVWYSGFSNIRSPRDADEMAEACRAASNPPRPAMLKSGADWTVAGYEDTLYNHVTQPGVAVVDCSSEGPPGPISGGSVTARSAHSGVVNILLMDGAVRAIGTGVDLQVWRAIATRSGHEAVDVGAQ